ncbi:C40 family peptidase [Mycolicibacterium aichiense]|uniref:NLP/P60 family protein n=1 Tax=Mycolicibacterium aichiense TaxID=1799 RepID=A0AAD1HS87_9MYCO|nr:C40 family peptidase [Mycolicibacterium aichiense]MCV7018727.1 C40 family peptidase [Mycolicibacterium aichiense]BBX10797.1 NLP/P60 family protein [Mycolicibacterium aichiense]STZ25545.1 NLP/P60 family protein [Mycolicibacterium aichiense]
MTASEVEILSRAHALFAGRQAVGELNAAPAALPYPGEGLPTAYHRGVERRRTELEGARRVDAEVSAILARVQRDHREAQRQTRAVLDAAHADAAAIPDSPVAQREFMRRRAARLRTQHAHVLAARRRARRRLALLRALGYRRGHRRLPAPNSRAALAVRAALSRLGCPYVWGATGPDRFDCSGLVKWAYAQAGVPLHRTTYDQINDGIPVPRSHIRPGDLVFPHAGHVQMAIGNGLVVEAPYSGANVRISRLGSDIAIRRPV